MSLAYMRINTLYRKIKQSRGEGTNNTTMTLETPVGTFHGQDVLEGFASDADDETSVSSFLRKCVRVTISVSATQDLPGPT